MNTNNLKRFAQETRRKLLEQVGSRLTFILNADTVLLREKTDQIKQLREELNRTPKEQLIEKVAYTWFNRLMALRFMDANDYQPLGLRIITPKDGFTIPELLDEAKKGNISEKLTVDSKRVFALLDNHIPSSNPQNEAYKDLLIAACNHLSSVLPFLFERINDYTELLLPDDLSSDFSVVTDLRNGMATEDCANVEIIGWLYQFYISEENERLIKSKNVYKKNELAPASELFTPKWIVQYMVDNTLGQLLTELFPSTSISTHLDFYIKPAYMAQIPKRNPKKLEEIKFLDPCVGSAHILSYAFDVFYRIYKEQGYSESEIPNLIIEHNLYGVDIDERAAQLASFVLMMKGRQYNRRFLKSDIHPNISFFRDFATDNKFKNASVLGSLIKIEPHEIRNVKVDESSLFGEQQLQLKILYTLLGQQYDVVVTNPPYISSARMEGSLKQFVEANYPDTKSDLFATFILRCLELCEDDGLTGYMSPFVWMFISSYDKLRNKIIKHHLINNLIQLEYSGFDGATVPICTFTLRKKPIDNALGSYIRLEDFKGSKVQAPKALEAIKNPTCGWFYRANQKDYNKISGSPIGYFLSPRSFDIFEKGVVISKLTKINKGISTSENNRFLRLWHEVNFPTISSNLNQYSKQVKWFYANKGGDFKKYYGNQEFVVNWNNNGQDLKSIKPKSVIRSPQNFFKPILAFSKISSSSFSVRKFEEGFISIDASSYLVNYENKIENLLLGVLNSKVFAYLLGKLTPTLNFEIGDISKFPLPIERDEDMLSELSKHVDMLIGISKIDWNSKETSWNFKKNELLINKNNTDQFELEEVFDNYCQIWKNKFFQHHQKEEELNRQFILIYGLQHEIKATVPLETITILQEEIDKKSLSKLNNKLVRDPETQIVKNYNDIALPFNFQAIIEQFISYAVGCMFGRYSIDHDGLVLADQGLAQTDYFRKINKSKSETAFLPDEDNIIPILEDEWFEDDIVARFYEFLKITFGEKNFNKNLTFIEDQIGKDIRKFFLKDFYPHHVQRYKKRPIYWMFSSSKGSFNVLIYLHRYTPDTINNILNKYLRELVNKIKTRKDYLNHTSEVGSASEKTQAIKEIDSIDKMLIELREYERDIIYPLAIERISITTGD